MGETISGRGAWAAAMVLAVCALLTTWARTSLQGGPYWELLSQLLDTATSLSIAGATVCAAGGLGLLQDLLAARSRPRVYAVLIGLGVALVLVTPALQMPLLGHGETPSSAGQFLSMALNTAAWLVRWLGFFVVALAAAGLVGAIRGRGRATGYGEGHAPDSDPPR